MSIKLEEFNNITQKVSLLLKLNRFETAERILNTALDDFGPKPELYNLLGLTYQKQSQFSKAMTHYRSAMELDPNYIEASLNLMVTLCDLGKYNEAQELNKKICRQTNLLKKHRPEMELKKLSAFHHAQGERYEACDLLPEAIGEFRKALALDENSKETQLSVARILYRSQQTRKAAAELEKLVKNSPEFIQGRIWLGICYHKLGRIEDAQTQWARANATDPTDVEGKAYLNIATNLDVKGFIRAT